MSTSKQSVPRKKRRPLRKLLSAAVLVGIGVAIKNAIADKGGSYAAPTGPAAAPTPPVQAAPTAAAEPTEPEPTPVKRKPGLATTVVTAEDIVAAEPAERPVTS